METKGKFEFCDCSKCEDTDDCKLQKILNDLYVIAKVDIMVELNKQGIATIRCSPEGLKNLASELIKVNGCLKGAEKDLIKIDVKFLVESLIEAEDHYKEDKIGLYNRENFFMELMAKIEEILEEGKSEFNKMMINFEKKNPSFEIMTDELTKHVYVMDNKIKILKKDIEDNFNELLENFNKKNNCQLKCTCDEFNAFVAGKAKNEVQKRNTKNKICKHRDKEIEDILLASKSMAES